MNKYGSCKNFVMIFYNQVASIISDNHGFKKFLNAKII